jgi:hypothetical protein
VVDWSAGSAILDLSAILCSAMPDQFEISDIAVQRRGRRWTWRVWTSEQRTVMSGRGDSVPLSGARLHASLDAVLQEYRHPYLPSEQYVVAAGIVGKNSRRVAVVVNLALAALWFAAAPDKATHTSRP